MSEFDNEFEDEDAFGLDVSNGKEHVQQCLKRFAMSC
jgi:hypothetical protein